MRNLLLSVAVMVSLASALACGNKQWPRPALEEESFTFANVSGRRQGKCLLVSADITGNAESLKAVSLQIEKADGCPTCPFSPDQRIEYRSGDPRFLHQDDKLSLSFCDPDLERMSRWRLTGTTILRPEDIVAGPVMPAPDASSNPKE